MVTHTNLLGQGDTQQTCYPMSQELHDSGEAEFGASAWRAGVEEAAAEAAAEAATAAAAAAATPMTREQAQYATELAEWQRQQDEYQRGLDVRPHPHRRAA